MLRLCHPDGKSLRAVTVNGQPHADFDRQRESITLPPSRERLEVRAEFE